MLEKLGPSSMFYVPAAIMVIQLGLTLWLESQARQAAATSRPTLVPAAPDPNPHPAARTKVFLRLAWLANPFAYIAINTVIAVIPGVAKRLELSTMVAGFCCSLWCFARVGAFLVLWHWDGWHYRFRWMLVAYVVMIGTFAAILTAPNLAVLVLVQI